MSIEKKWILALAFAAGTLGAEAQITWGNQGAVDSVQTWKISNLNGNPSVTNGTVTNILTGIGGFNTNDSISLTARGYYGWNTANGQVAASNGTLSAYISGLQLVSLGALPSIGDIGVNSSSVTNDDFVDRLGGTPGNDEVIVFTVDLSQLSVTNSIALTAVNLSSFTAANDRADYAVYDSTGNNLVFASWNAQNGSTNGNWTLKNGDLILIGMGSSGGGNNVFRFQNFGLDAFTGFTGVVAPLDLLAAPKNSLITLNWERTAHQRVCPLRSVPCGNQQCEQSRPAHNRDHQCVF
jgi:hypothetical protein